MKSRAGQNARAVDNHAGGPGGSPVVAAGGELRGVVRYVLIIVRVGAARLPGLPYICLFFFIIISRANWIEAAIVSKMLCCPFAL